MSVIINGSAGVTTNSGAVYDGIQRGAVTTTTSGTTVPYTSIPSWVKRITIMFSGVSLSGTDNLLVQLGDTGGVETTGYVSSSGNYNNANGTAVSNSTSGFIMRLASSSLAASGHMVLTNVSGNVWVSSHYTRLGLTDISNGGGTKTLSDSLNQILVLTTGTNTFAAGSINILYE
jgi:hypothetical protein